MAPPKQSQANGATTESHTLSAQTLALPTTTPESLLAALEKEPHLFLQPTTALHAAALRSAKRFLDPLALGINEAQTERLRASKKRKRGRHDAEDERLNNILRIKKITLEGFGVEQIWEQVRRVLDAAGKETEVAIPLDHEEDEARRGDDVKMVRFDDEGYEVLSDEDDEEMSLDEEELDEDMDGVDDGQYFDGEDEDLNDTMNYDLEDDYEDAEDDERVSEFVADPNGLNDGFFSIDDFNRQSEFLERQDAKGDPDDGAASDEEDVDWAADPLTVDSGVAVKSKALSVDKSKQQDGFDDYDEDEDDDDEDDDDEGAPTFGNMDLDAPEGASDDGSALDDDGELDGVDDMGNENYMYSDFFAPPAKKGNKNKRGRPHPHNFPQQNGIITNGKRRADEEDEDVEGTMSRIHRDLFSESENEEDQEAEELDPGDPKSRRSTHERRQAALAEEIRKLEAQNVAKREWTLAGEARAADRPLNSLLEEDLDFERAGKPVPVITAEVSEDIEAMIKRRIIAREFDEVIRRRPDSIAPQTSRRGKLDFELSDQKSKQGLAELYEEEHLRRTDPNFADVKDEKLRKEHKEIEALWKEVSGKLDALSSWHYRPKPTAPQLEVRVDAPVLAMEDARPTAGGEIAGASGLAPQEVYKPGEVKVAGEIVGKDGLPVQREELSREQKKRRRMREKERMKKSSTALTNGNAKSKREEEQSNIVGELKRGGVKVIGKKGELRDVDGKQPKNKLAAITGGAFKL